MRNKTLILSILGTLLFASIAIAGSYAYFVANVTGNKDTNNVVITNGVMSLEYKDGDEITLDNAIPGSSVTKTFTVKNTGNVATNYTIYFSELVNSFVDKTDLVYTLSSTDGGKSVAQTQVPDSNIAMVSNYSIAAGKTHTYSLTITFLSKDEVQDDNQGVSFKTKVMINETKEYVLTFAEQIVDLSVKDTINFATDDPDNNIRYIGKDPSNYVYFNCSDYSNQNDETCEKWRIIGVFKNMTSENGLQADLVKIIRDDSLGELVLNTNDINDWTTASLQTTLNDPYYNGTYENDAIKNDLTRNAIESVVWNLGGLNSSSNTASTFYSAERGTTVYSGRPITWTGKIGLMYPSDYGYATAGGTTTNREVCLTTNMSSWNVGFSSDGGTDCNKNDYLRKGYQLAISPFSNDSSYMFILSPYGNVENRPSNYSLNIYPALYLKSNISISQGNGSSSNPYQLKLD